MKINKKMKREVKKSLRKSSVTFKHERKIDKKSHKSYSLNPVVGFSFEVGELVQWRKGRGICVGIIVEKTKTRLFNPVDVRTTDSETYEVLTNSGTIQKVRAWKLRKAD